MILLKINGFGAVINVEYDVDNTYTPKEDEVLVEDFPPLTLNDKQIAYIYYKEGSIEYDIQEKHI